MASPTTNDLRAVWGTSSSDVYAAGNGSTILHFDGTEWTTMELSNPQEVSLNSISGTSPTDIFAAGDGGLLLHFDGIGWGPVALQDANTQVVAASAHGVFLFGPDNRRLLRSTPW